MHFNKLLKYLLLSSSLYAVNANSAQIFNECIQPGQVALTFDDGPDKIQTPKLLDYLKAENIKATFFVNGKNFGNIENSTDTQEIIRRQISEGHEVGSHTFFHKPCFIAYEEGSLKENIERLEKDLKEVINFTPRFFRPPQGQGGFSEEYCKKIQIDYDPRTEIIRGILSGDGYKYGSDYGDYDYDIILWNADSEDWKCDGKDITIDHVMESLEYSMGPDKADPSTNSFILLMHDVKNYTVDVVVPTVVKTIREKGYNIVPLSECIGRSPYRENLNTITKVNTSHEIQDSSSYKDNIFKILIFTFSSVVISIMFNLFY
ncbi:glycoside hydrolase/deacetylase [Neocallimastix californiae]|uniref:Glycoside hydrolase/deacetylase n=1 Tax=Neocallimastix californiae TaxID=1754190 RepID=A0A1Y2ADH4_9FUNG|nr:glycoside hydrolase/deacetylase [Neocallimastix californiae]|eukprot:ORY20556.1 glycoside hydrolase/deacetylase [Neocallimastix californiae]